MSEELTLEELCKIAEEDSKKAAYIGNFIKHALFDEHQEMRNEATEKLKKETIAGYRIMRSFKAGNEVLVVLDLNLSEDPRLTNPQLIPLRTITEDYEKPVHHFKIDYDHFKP